MVTRDFLLQAGFVEGTGFASEVWVYDGRFWVGYPEGRPSNFVSELNEDDHFLAERLSNAELIEEMLSIAELKGMENG